MDCTTRLQMEDHSVYNVGVPNLLEPVGTLGILGTVNGYHSKIAAVRTTHKVAAIQVWIKQNLSGGFTKC